MTDQADEPLQLTDAERSQATERGLPIAEPGPLRHYELTAHSPS